MKPKIAYLFLTYEDLAQPELWQRYFAGHEETTRTCCHAARREGVQTPWLKDSLIPYWVSTKWGQLGLVIAQLELIRYALRDKQVERLVLCSDSCVPIKTHTHTYDVLFEQNKSWLTMYRQYIHRMAKVTHLDKLSYRKHSQWVALTRKHAELLVTFNYLSDFTHCIVPDEHYVGSVLVHLGEQRNILQKDQTYAKWASVSPVQMSPNEHSVLSDETINELRKTPALFARKFKADSDIGARWQDIIG